MTITSGTQNGKDFNLGVDFVDCVLPTRKIRAHGEFTTDLGQSNPYTFDSTADTVATEKALRAFVAKEGRKITHLMIQAVA